MNGSTHNGEAIAPTVVVVFDLAEDGEALLTTPVSDLQIMRSPPVRGGTIDARRVLVHSALDDVERYAGALERLQSAPSVDRVVCLLRGLPDEDAAAGPRIVLPTVLDTLGVVTVWVSDPRGVVWEEGSSRARRLAAFQGDPEGEGAFLHLLETLRLPEVFDEVYERSGSRAVVSPATRAFLPGITDRRLLDAAVLGALQELTAASEASRGPSRAVSPPDVSGTSALPSDFFTSGGTIGTKTAAVRAASEESFAQMRRLRERPSQDQRRTATRAVFAMADALADLKGEVRELFRRVEASNGLDEAERKLVQRAGVREQVQEAFHAREADGGAEEEKLRQYVVSQIREVRALPAIIGDLRALARLAKPRWSETTVELLDERCPDSVIHRLRTPPSFNFQPDAAGVAFLTAFGLTIPWWPSILPIVPALMMLGVVLYFAWLASDGTWPGWRSVVSGLSALPNSGGFVIRIVALTLGVATGVVVLLAVGSSLVLHIVGPLGSVVFLFAYVLATWHHAVDEWVAGWGIADVASPQATAEGRGGVEGRTLAGRVLATAREVIAVDWLAANARTELGIVLTRLADALDMLRGVLVEFERDRRAEQHDGSETTPPPACNPAVRVDLEAPASAELHRRSDVIENIVTLDYIDAIIHALDAPWPLLTAKVEDRPGDRVVDEFRPWLEQYASVLHRYGLFGHGVPFEEEARLLLSRVGLERRRELLEAVWRGLALDTLLSDEDLLQFCRAEDLGLLDQDASYTVIRFAPATSGPPGSVVQTSSVFMAGVLRLVPLRASATHFVAELPPDADASTTHGDRHGVRV
jgi:hypothetical protein